MGLLLLVRDLLRTSRRMRSTERVQLEAEVRRLCEAGDARGAVTAAIRGLGPELMGFLIVVAGGPDDASDVFSDLCVRMWRSLHGFRWESSLRTWAYTLTRRALHEHRQRRATWKQRMVPISEVPEIDELIVRVRTTTLAGLRQGRRSRAESLRARLDPDDQILLTLRLSRGLEWRDIAKVLAEADDLDEAAVMRAAASLRKRFERLKVRLKKMAAEESS